jgi:hypothetical protein
VQTIKNMRLKSWESPRREGRNSKGKGGSARARQLKKQQQTLRKQLKVQHDRPNQQQNQPGKETDNSFPYFFVSFCGSIALNVRTNRASNGLRRGLLLPAVENALQLPLQSF